MKLPHASVNEQVAGWIRPVVANLPLLLKVRPAGGNRRLASSIGGVGNILGCIFVVDLPINAWY
jgi:hypothetical protein